MYTVLRSLRQITVPFKMVRQSGKVGKLRNRSFFHAAKLATIAETMPDKGSNRKSSSSDDGGSLSLTDLVTDGQNFDGSIEEVPDPAPLFFTSLTDNPIPDPLFYTSLNDS